VITLTPVSAKFVRITQTALIENAPRGRCGLSVSTWRRRVQEGRSENR
jgi:hypothetical protein